MAGTFGLLRGFDRYYSALLTDSFYTAFPESEDQVSLANYNLIASDYFYLFASERPGTVPIYRYVLSAGGDGNHFYTRSSSTPPNYVSEGIVGWGFTSTGSNRVPIYRWYHIENVDHRYTTSVSNPPGYIYEDIEWYSPVIVNGCSDPLANNYNSDVNQTSTGCTYSPPIVSFSFSPTSIIKSASSTLSWNVTGSYISSVSINQGIGSVTASGSRSVSPTSTTTYTITATGAGGTTTEAATLIVYQPTTTNLSLDDLTIIRGQNTTLRWATTGDATAATIDKGIGAVNINGNRNISPTETITYTINVTGICTNSSDSVTLIVYQPPTVDITGPESLNYGQQGTLSYEATDADISLRVTPTYNYRGSSIVGTVVNLPIGASVDGQITTQIPYNDFGPFNVTYVIVATGNGGQESDQITIPINIDETPTNVLVPESEDLLKDQAPIYTPDGIATSYKIVIGDIDIPVEIKADKPILIDKNEQQDWERLRSI